MPSDLQWISRVETSRSLRDDQPINSDDRPQPSPIAPAILAFLTCGAAVVAAAALMALLV